jgi:hypothetical protein
VNPSLTGSIRHPLPTEFHLKVIGFNILGKPNVGFSKFYVIVVRRSINFTGLQHFLVFLTPNPKSGFSFPPGWVREPARTAGRRIVRAKFLVLLIKQKYKKKNSIFTL